MNETMKEIELLNEVQSFNENGLCRKRPSSSFNNCIYLFYYYSSMNKLIWIKRVKWTQFKINYSFRCKQSVELKWKEEWNNGMKWSDWVIRSFHSSGARQWVIAFAILSLNHSQFYLFKQFNCISIQFGSELLAVNGKGEFNWEMHLNLNHSIH